VRPDHHARVARPPSPASGLVRAALLVLLASGGTTAAAAEPRPGGPERPFGPGERIDFRISWAHLRAGRATLAVLPGDQEGSSVMRFLAEARSEGPLAWLLRFHVDDHTTATWDAEGGYSLRIEKHLHEGRAARDQTVSFDPETGTADVSDAKIPQSRFDVGICPLDVLSALFVARVRGVEERGELRLAVFDNGKRYVMGVRWQGREKLDLPPPFGPAYPTVIVEPQLVEGTGLFVREGRVQVWLTDDGRRVPVRMRSRVAVGAVSAEMERYQPSRSVPEPEAGPRPSASVD